VSVILAVVLSWRARWSSDSGIVISVAVAAACAASFATLFLRRTTPLGSEVLAPPVDVVSGRGSHWVFAVRNIGWAEDFATMNGGLSRPLIAAQPLVWIAWAAFLGGVVSSVLGYATWSISHSAVYVDDVGAAPRALWVDGRLTDEVRPGQPRRLVVTIGHHDLGESALGARAPEKSVPVLTLEDLLFTVGGSACYRRDVMVTGRKRLPSDLGPDDEKIQHIGPVQVLRGVDELLGQRIRGSARSGRQVSLTRDGSCSDFAKGGCPVETLNDIAHCSNTTGTSDELEHCLAGLDLSCAKGSP
jgi:hypothetical protein